MGILADLFEALDPAPDVGIVLFDLIEQARRFLARERRRLRGDRIQEDLALDLRVVVVREREHGIGEAEAVELLEAPQPFQAGDVAVGDEVHRAVLRPFGIVVVVLDDHQHVAALDLLLGRENVAPDPLVVAVGPLVRTRDDNRLVASVAGVAILEFLEKLAALDRLDVREIHAETRNGADAVLEHAPDKRGVEQDARFGLLAHDLVERAVDHLAVALHRRRVECRAEVRTHGRQLCAVAHEDQAAAPSVTDILHQVTEQRPAAEMCPLRGALGEHRGLIDDEHGPLFGIVVERVLRFVVGIRALAVDPLVDRERTFPGVAGQHLGGPSRRGEQYGADSRLLECPHQSRDECRFSRSRIAVQHENPRKIVISKVFRQLFYDFFLPGSCFETNFTVNLGRNTCAGHACFI